MLEIERCKNVEMYFFVILTWVFIILKKNFFDVMAVILIMGLLRPREKLAHIIRQFSHVLNKFEQENFVY